MHILKLKLIYAVHVVMLCESLQYSSMQFLYDFCCQYRTFVARGDILSCFSTSPKFFFAFLKKYPRVFFFSLFSKLIVHKGW